jgi:hypothetical protein
MCATWMLQLQMRWPKSGGMELGGGRVVRALPKYARADMRDVRAVCSQSATTDVRAFGGAVLCASGDYEQR